MVTCDKVLAVMEKIAPKALAEEWDNVGLLVGSPRQEVHKILVCLDANEDIIDEAMEAGADLIVSHHPLIFKAIKAVRTDSSLGARLQKLLAHNIALIAAHTNLDAAPGGVNDTLAASLGLTEIKPLDKNATAESPGLGRLGLLPTAMSLTDFGELVKKALGLKQVRVVKAREAPVKKVALCGGSGAEFIDRAAFRGADVYVTGDVRYHDAQRAAELGLNLIDAGHFATEQPVVKVLAGKLAAEIPEVTVLTATRSTDFFTL
ncbi:MAG: Nif3-like dinuclear metal center hexameric protein [Selenomonadaceae bacterium]|nr:Nif3-like dinuclear metal center hexameric protein [Selenomonadaceae bacterium]